MNSARRDKSYDPLLRARKRRGWQKFFCFSAAIALAAMVGGFLSFASIVHNMEKPETLPAADGIVVWTGAGGGRLEAATDLLEQGKGERLLISGVNEKNSRDDIMDLLGAPAPLAACCIDLDYAAQNTIGNARETAAWTGALGYEHIILVTSAYHMPRATVEIGHAAGRIRITRYPVTSLDNGPWWKDKKQLTRYANEYGKLIGSLLREPRQARKAGPPVLPHPERQGAADKPVQSDDAKADPAPLSPQPPGKP
jgi:uncharacterized SAM-binding protein YcdF (DUF218 family)